MTANYVEVLFEKHQNLIESALQRNRNLLASLGIEEDDATQELSIAMLAEIEGCGYYEQNSVEERITVRLQNEIFRMKTEHLPHGVTGVPNGEVIDFFSLDRTKARGERGKYSVIGGDERRAAA